MNKKLDKRYIWFALGSVLGVGFALGIASLIMVFIPVKNKDILSLHSNTDVLAYDKSYSDVTLTADFSEPGDDWAKWEILDDGTQVENKTSHCVLERDDSACSSDREVYHLKYFYSLYTQYNDMDDWNDNNQNADKYIPKQITIRVADFDGSSVETKVWLLPSYQTSTIAVNGVPGSNEPVSINNPMYNDIISLDGDHIGNGGYRCDMSFVKTNDGIVFNDPFPSTYGASMKNFFSLIHNKAPIDLQNESPWGSDVKKFFNKDCNAQDVALMFTLEKLSMLADDGQIGGEMSIIVREIERDSLLHPGGADDSFDINIQTEYTPPGSFIPQRTNYWNVVQTRSGNNSSYFGGTFTDNPDLWAPAKVCFATQQDDNIDTNTDSYHLKFVPTSDANSIMGYAAEDGSILNTWTTSNPMNLYMYNSIGDLQTSYFDTAASILLNGTILPVEEY